MRDFYFYTSEKLTAQNCFDALQKEIPNIERNGDINLWVNAKSRSFLWFYNSTFSDGVYDNDEKLKEDKLLIPINEPYINHFETHRSIDAKRFVKVLMQLYPELYVELNDSESWFGTAQEFLDKNFDW